MIVEILLATYNGERYLREQFDSIIEQTESNWHITVSDDQSSDGTVDIIQEYEAHFPNRITFIRHDNRFGNARDHFVFLMSHCKADWMLFCDQDDTWFPDKIRVFCEEIEKAENKYGKGMPLLIFSDQVPTDAELHPLGTSLMRYQRQYSEHFDYRSILMQNVVTGGAMGINRALAELGGKCIDISQIIMHDWWLAGVCARFGRIIYLDMPLGTYRQHENNEVGAKNYNNIFFTVHQAIRFKHFKESVIKKKEQANIFYRTYDLLLSNDDKSFLLLFAKEKSGIAFYLKYWYLIHDIRRIIMFLLLG